MVASLVLTARAWFAKPSGRIAAAIALYVAVALALFFPLFSRHAWLTWDLPDEYWPDLVYLCGSIRDGVWPWWNPYDRLGYPFHADPQVGMYHPLNLAICLVGGRSPSMLWAELRVVFHFALAGSSMCALLRSLKLPWSAGIVGGLAFMLAPFQRQMWEVDPSYTIAYLPLVLWSIERAVQQPDIRRAGVLALIVALTCSSGSPPALYFTLVTAAIYAAARMRRDNVLSFALAALLSAGMCAVMIVPALAMSHASVQQGNDFARIAADAYPLRDVVGLVWPRNKYLYLGAPVALLSLWGAFAPRNPLTRAQRVLFGGLALYALMMMFGDHTPLFRIAYHVVPGVRAFRAPTRYSSILGATTAVLVACGVARLPRPAWSASLAGALIVGVACTALPEHRDFHDPPAPGSDARWSALRARMVDVENTWRIFDEFGVGLRAGTRHLARDFRGYQDPLLDARYAAVINRLDASPQLLEQFNVRYLLRGPHFLHGEAHHFLPVGTEARIADDRGDGLWETREPIPAAYWVGRVDVVSDRNDALERLMSVAPAPVCMIERGDLGGSIPSGGSDAWRPAQRVTIARNSAVVDIAASSDGCLVLNESYGPGWEADVDGIAVPVFRANVLVRAVPVPAGRHRVTFRYEPRRDRWLALLALVSLVAALATTLWRPRPATA